VVIILSFVVQNYFVNSLFVPKTQRYKKALALRETVTLKVALLNLCYFFSQPKASNQQQSLIESTLWKLLFTTPLLYKLSTVYTRPKNLLVSNLVSSFSYHTVSQLLVNFLKPAYRSLISVPPKLRQGYNQSFFTVGYLVKFSVHKKTYNSFIIYLFNILTLVPTTSTNIYTLVHSYLFFAH